MEDKVLFEVSVDYESIDQLLQDFGDSNGISVDLNNYINYSWLLELCLSDKVKHLNLIVSDSDLDVIADFKSKIGLDSLELTLYRWSDDVHNDFAILLENNKHTLRSLEIKIYSDERLSLQTLKNLLNLLDSFNRYTVEFQFHLNDLGIELANFAIDLRGRFSDVPFESACILTIEHNKTGRLTKAAN